MLIVDPDNRRRRALSEGLAELGYDSVPAAGPEEGRRFARGLDPELVIADRSLAGFGDGRVLDDLTPRPGRTLVLLDDSDSAAEPADDLPSEELHLLATAGLSRHEILHRLQLVLVGREVGVDPDLDLRFLVGDLALQPLLEVLRALHRSGVSGRIDLPEPDAIFLARGEVVAARAGTARGIKAFCRLARHDEGPFHIHLGPQTTERELETELSELVLQAVEELQVELPDPRSRLRVTALGEPVDGDNDFDQLLEAVARCDTVGELLDTLPATDGRIAQALRVLIERGEVRLEKPRAAVRVITDSTADLPQELARAHDVEVAPLTIHFGDHAFRDGVELRARDFYKLLATSDEHPFTRPPPEAELYEHFCDLITTQDVVAVHISGKLSETVEHARQAALRGIRGFDHLPPERHDFALEVVDSRSVSIGVGLLALFAARMAGRDQKVFAIVERLRSLIPRMQLLFMVDTLDYLVRGGRVGRARALIGKLLGIKPILGMVDGEVAPVARARGRRAYRRLVERLVEWADPALPVVVGVGHAQAPARAERLRSLIEERFTVREMIRTDIGPVVGTHAGPGCVGCAVIQPTDEEWELISPLQAGPLQAGPLQAGPLQAGPLQAGPLQAGPLQAG